MNTEITSIFNFSSDPIFDFEEALELVPILNTITRNIKQEVHILNSRLSFVAHESEQALSLRREINIKISKWSDKVRRLGAVPLAPFKAEFNGHEGRYIWEYPQKDLSYFNQ